MLANYVLFFFPIDADAFSTLGDPPLFAFASKVFASIYFVDIFMRFVAEPCSSYLASGWNRFDFIVSSAYAFCFLSPLILDLVECVNEWGTCSVLLSIQMMKT